MGHYVRATLLRGEEIIFETRYHWLVYTGGPLGILLVLLSIGYFLIVLLVAFPFVFITRYSSEFAVTNKRVIIKTGWLFRRTVELMLSKVESLDVSQGIFGRMFNYGNVTVVGTGGTREKFRFVEQPLMLRRAVQSQGGESASQS